MRRVVRTVARRVRRGEHTDEDLDENFDQLVIEERISNFNEATPSEHTTEQRTSNEMVTVMAAVVGRMR